MYRFEESKRVKKLNFKEFAPRFLSIDDFMKHFVSQIFPNEIPTCGFEIINLPQNKMIDLNQPQPFVIKKLYKQKFNTFVTPAKLEPIKQKRKKRWKSKSPKKKRKRKRRWRSPKRVVNS